MNFTEISSIITIGILAALFGMSLLQLSSVKENLRIQSEQQINVRQLESGYESHVWRASGFTA